MLRACVYLRVSGRGQEDNSSLRTQQEVAELYCSNMGYTVVERVKEVHTAEDLDERPELSKIRMGFRHKLFDVLVVWRMDRLSRDQQHQAVILYEAAKHAIKVESATEDNDNSPVGAFVRSATGFAAAVEHGAIKARTMAGRQARAKEGSLTGARLLYGYQWADERRTKFVVDEGQAPIVVRIFEEVARGLSRIGVCRLLLEQGIPSPTGGKWHIHAISRMINNPTYYGEPVAFRWKTHRESRIDPKTGQAKKVAVLKEVEGIPLPPGTAPSVVPKEVAMKAREALKATAIGYNPRKWAVELYLLHGGYARCEYCGRALTTFMKTSDNKPSYRCSTNVFKPGSCTYNVIYATRLDREVWEVVEAALRMPQPLMEALRARPEVVARSVQTLREQLRDVALEQSRLAKAIARIDDDSVATPLIEEVRSLSKLVETLNTDLARALQTEAVQGELDKHLEELGEYCRRVVEGGVLGFEEKRKVLFILGVQAIVRRGKKNEKRVDVYAQPQRVPNMTKNNILQQGCTLFTRVCLSQLYKADYMKQSAL